jgi:hypothetical protein
MNRVAAMSLLLMPPAANSTVPKKTARIARTMAV